MKEINTYINLLNKTNIIRVPVNISINKTEGKEIIEISLIYNNVEYIGVGSEWLWEDAFTDLQRKLPKDVKLLCCMTCRYGNMCPFGNEPRELYCTKDRNVSNKNQLAELFNEDKINQDNKVYCDYYCDDYEEQDTNNYTYNDYLYYLNRREEK